MEISLSKMSIEEKLKLMEMIWNDLLKTEKKVPSPDWHKEVLIERERNLKNGNEKFVEWKEAKKEIRRILHED